MVARLPLLILLPTLLLALFLPGSLLAGARGCCGCHPLHYTDLGSCVSCHRGDDRTDRKRIAHNQLISARYAGFTLPGSDRVARGKRLLERFGCRRCHTAGREGTALAASLDRLGEKAPEELAAAIARPASGMPDFRFAAAEQDELVKYLLRLGREGAGVKKELPVVIHFSGKGKGGEHPFVKRCGGCHRALTEKLGSVGRGGTGPNLSALFTPYYPGRYREGEPWSEQRLREWINNPRTSRQSAVMPPVVLGNDEREMIIELLTVSRQGCGSGYR